MDLDTLNKLHVEETFKRMSGNKARTARALGIGRRTLYRLLEKYGIEATGQEE
jgi:DNA-binding NtrC family response regulator